MNYLTNSNFCYRYQFGFRKNQPMGFSISYLRDKIPTEFDSVLFPGMIFINLQNKFGTTNHEILLKECPLLDFQINQRIDLNLTFPIDVFE